jgi:hypothetical protein
VPSPELFLSAVGCRESITSVIQIVAKYASVSEKGFLGVLSLVLGWAVS